jgi:hypothetical protein
LELFRTTRLIEVACTSAVFTSTSPLPPVSTTSVTLAGSVSS